MRSKQKNTKILASIFLLHNIDFSKPFQMYYRLILISLKSVQFLGYNVYKLQRPSRAKSLESVHFMVFYFLESLCNLCIKTHSENQTYCHILDLNFKRIHVRSNFPSQCLHNEFNIMIETLILKKLYTNY